MASDSSGTAALAAPIAGRRPWLTAATAAGAAALAGAAIARFGVEPDGFIAAYVAAVLVVVSAIDIERRVIPNRIVVPSIALVLAARIAFYPEDSVEWVIAALGAGFVMSLPGLVRPGSIGMGDAKLAMLMGAALGDGVVVAVMLGFVASLPAALAIVAIRGAAARKQHIPLGPFLAVGALIVLFAAPGA